MSARVSQARLRGHQLGTVYRQCTHYPRTDFFPRTVFQNLGRLSRNKNWSHRDLSRVPRNKNWSYRSTIDRVSINYRPILGKLSARYRWSIGEVSVNWKLYRHTYRPIYRRSIGRQLPNISTDISPESTYISRRNPLEIHWKFLTVRRLVCEN